MSYSTTLKKFLYLGVECVQIIKQYHNLLRLVLFVRSLVLLCFIARNALVETSALNYTMNDHNGCEPDFESEFVHLYLPRKEVIHPQLPLRMPCYDFTLITNPTVVPDLTRGLLVLPALLV